MRTLIQFFVIFLSIYGCKNGNQNPKQIPTSSNKKENKNPITEAAWVSKDMIYDSVDLGERDYMIYGLGTILRFEPNHEFKAITKRFEFEQDTVLTGEGIGNYSHGEWKEIDKIIIIRRKYIEPSDDRLIGKIINDTMLLKDNILISSKGEKYKPARFFSSFISKMIYQEKWVE